MSLAAKDVSLQNQEKIENQSKVKKVYVKDTANWYSAYTDFYIKDDLGLYMINITGFDSAVKGIASTLIKGEDLFIDNEAYFFPRKSRMIKQKVGKYTNTLLFNCKFIEGGKRENLFVITNDETLEDKVFQIIKDNYSVPMLEEWMPILCKFLLEEDYLQELDVFATKPYHPKAAYALRLTNTNLQIIITKLLTKGVISIPGPEEDLDEIETLDDYLLKYGKELADKIVDKNKPLFTPGKDPYPEYISKLKRKPLGIQNDVMAASVKKLEQDSAVIINAEMGTGKSLMGAAIPYIMEKGKPMRVLVMCPGHLVNKWAREVKDTIPNAKTFIIRKVRDLFSIPKKPKGIEYYIISKDRAKLGYSLIPGVVYKKHTGGVFGPAFCPDCGKELMKDKTEYMDFSRPQKSNYKCNECGAILWQADNSRLRRFPLAKYISKKMKGYFKYFIADEIHEYKGETAQGNSFAQLCATCDKTIGLTGTLAGGYASNLFYILYRMFPHKLSRYFDYNKITDFVEQYGFIEKQFKKKKSDFDLNTSSFGCKGKLLSTKELPGISPMMFPNFLMDSCIYASLSDLQINLPDYKEEVRIVDMEGDLKTAYSELQNKLQEIVLESLRRGSKALLSTYLINLLSYPDRPFDNKPVLNPDDNQVLYLPRELSKDVIYPKERELLNLVQEEVAEGRKVFVYVQYTNKRDITKRLKNILQEHGFATAVLKSNTVKQEKREDWINYRVFQGIDVIIANPELVKTGLDLIDFPTIVFFQTGYSLYTLMQAARRSWRIGQKDDVRVYFMAYRNTMQESAMQLMGKKYEASMVVNGKFSLEGLAQMAGDDSMVIALAKALTGKIEVESAEDIWKRLYKPIVKKKVKPKKKEKIKLSNAKKTPKVEFKGQFALDLNALLG